MGIKSFPRTYASINLAALAHNFQQVKHNAPKAKVLAMLKANAYGHGLIQVARALQQADAFGVACLQEAVELRQAGITTDIVLMSGFMIPDELKDIEHYQLDFVIHHPEQLRQLEQCSIAQFKRVWLKLDTGMHRLGFSPCELQDCIKRVKTLSSVPWPPVIMTHFACADDQKNQQTEQQIATMQQWIDSKEFPISMANSAAILAWSDSHADWVRPGIMLYGSSPLAFTAANTLNLQPVMTLRSRLIAIKTINKGDAVGYGATWHAAENTRIGIVAIGYGDGYPRHAVSGTPVLINQIRCPIIGRVSMDLLAVELQNCPDAEVGNEVILWGEGLSVDEIAYAAGTISYELLTQVTGRVVMDYVNDSTDHSTGSR